MCTHKEMYKTMPGILNVLHRKLIVETGFQIARANVLPETHLEAVVSGAVSNPVHLQKNRSTCLTPTGGADAVGWGLTLRRVGTGH